MNVTKVGNFAEYEVESLSEAGKLLGNAARDLESGELNKLGEESMELVEALASVIDRIRAFK